MAGAYAFAPYAVIDEAVLDAYGAGLLVSGQVFEFVVRDTRGIY